MPGNNQEVVYSIPDDGFKCYGEKEKPIGYEVKNKNHERPH